MNSRPFARNASRPTNIRVRSRSSRSYPRDPLGRSSNAICGTSSSPAAVTARPEASESLSSAGPGITPGPVFVFRRHFFANSSRDVTFLVTYGPQTTECRRPFFLISTPQKPSENAPPTASPSCQERREEKRKENRKNGRTDGREEASMGMATKRTGSTLGGLRTAGASRRRTRQPNGAPPRRSSGRLASSRDRRRLDERIAEERERVERALASAPISIDMLDGSLSPASFAPTVPSPSSLHALAPLACPVCSGTQIVCDEVFQLGALRLSECLRCDHRWTDRGPSRWAEVGATMKRVVRPAPIRVIAEDARAS